MLDDGYDGTRVCHFFAKEWKKQGHDVRVVRFSSLFPRLLYWVASLFKEKIKAATGAVVYTKRLSTPLHYEIEGIPVLVMPIFKFLPHQVPNYNKLKAKIRIILDDFSQNGFCPDIVTAHFRNPQLMALSIIKDIRHDVRTCMVMHCNGSVLPKLYGNRLVSYMKNIDVWGFRSYAFRDEFQKKYGQQDNVFVCVSGIPDNYVRKSPKKIGMVRNFVFVGSLYELKRVDDTICALAQSYSNEPFEFHIVGDGAEKSRLCQLAKDLGVADRVFFHGRKTRDEAQQYMDSADVFVMVSSHEAFGLVYVEAMAKGCITIGTIGQGIDGVIVHGKNGFLCQSCNVNALSALIDEIREMPYEKIQEVSNNAIETATQMTNEKVADLYLHNIIKKC